MKWREHWYTRVLVWIFIGAPFAITASVLEQRWGWSSAEYACGFAAGVTVSVIDGLGERDQ